MSAQDTPYANIPGLRTDPFIPAEGFASFAGCHKHVHYSFMQATVNENNKLDVSIFNYTCAFKEDGSVYGSYRSEEEHGRWRNISLDKAIKLLKKWDTRQKDAQATPYDGELLCRKGNKPALQILSDENIAALRQTLATSRQSPITVTSEKELVSKQGLERVFNYLAARKDQRTGLYTVCNTTETQEARNRLAALFNKYRTLSNLDEYVAENLSLEDATQKVKAGPPKQSRG